MNEELRNEIEEVTTNDMEPVEGYEEYEAYDDFEEEGNGFVRKLAIGAVGALVATGAGIACRKIRPVRTFLNERSAKRLEKDGYTIVRPEQTVIVDAEIADIVQEDEE